MISARISGFGAAAALWSLMTSAALPQLSSSMATPSISTERASVSSASTPPRLSGRAARTNPSSASKPKNACANCSTPEFLLPQGLDRYRRTLAKVYVGEVNIGEVLIREGHALPYTPGPPSPKRHGLQRGARHECRTAQPFGTKRDALMREAARKANEMKKGYLTCAHY